MFLQAAGAIDHSQVNEDLVVILQELGLDAPSENLVYIRLVNSI